MPKLRPVEDRFLGLVEKGQDCWLWKGTRSGYEKRYGSFRTGTRKGNRYGERAHRTAYRLFVGPIPRGLCVLHRCDNTLCVRPDHLFLGTNKDNTQDMIVKGRRVPAYTYQPYRPNAGVFKLGHTAYNKGRPRIE